MEKQLRTGRGAHALLAVICQTQETFWYPFHPADGGEKGALFLEPFADQYREHQAAIDGGTGQDEQTEK